MKLDKPTITLFEDEASRVANTRTIQIHGVERGGTTAVAGVVRRMGVFLGEDLGANLEDTSFRLKRGLEPLLRTVESRNDAHQVWGWKHPGALNYLEELVPSLRNPRFIFVTRDLTANATGLSARGNQQDLAAARSWLHRTRKNLDFAERHKRPTLLVSYEKLLVSPESTVRDIAAFCNIELDAERVAHCVSFIRPGRYDHLEGARMSSTPIEASRKLLKLVGGSVLRRLGKR